MFFFNIVAKNKNPENAKKPPPAFALTIVFLVFRFPDYYPIRIDGVDVGFWGEFTHKQKPTSTPSETQSQSGKRVFIVFFNLPTLQPNRRLRER